MIRITFKEPVGNYVDYPGATGTQVWADGMVAVYRENQPGMKEVIAVVEEANVLSTETLPEEST